MVALAVEERLAFGARRFAVWTLQAGRSKPGGVGGGGTRPKNVRFLHPCWTEPLIGLNARTQPRDSGMGYGRDS